MINPIAPDGRTIHVYDDLTATRAGYPVVKWQRPYTTEDVRRWMDESIAHWRQRGWIVVDHRTRPQP